MKKLLAMATAAMLFAACSDDFDASGVSLLSDNTDAQYMAFNIVMNNTETRALADDDATTYANGTTDEYAVDTNAVAFFFFDADGAAYSVDAEGHNYSTPTSISFTTTTDDTTSPNTQTDGSAVTTYSSSIVVIKNATGTTPSQVVAVVNYDGLFTLETMPMDTLRARLVTAGSYQKTTTVPEPESHAPTSDSAKPGTRAVAAESGSSTTNTYFLMSNSVYKTTSGNVYATEIKSSNIAKTASGAASSPVNIYVERVVAKVTTADALRTTLYPVQDSTATAQNLSITLAGQTTAMGTLYVRFKGWTLYNRVGRSSLLKNIEENADYKYANWNDASNYRSYWATMADSCVVPKANLKLSYTAMSDNFDVEYPFENTLGKVSGAPQDTVHTSIVFAAEIVQLKENTSAATGNDTVAVTLVKWLSKYYTLATAKEAIANYLRNDLFTLSSQTITSDDNNSTTVYTWTPISANVIGFKAVDDSYYVTVDLPDSTIYYAKNNSTTALTKAEVGTILSNVPKIQIWNEGRCYYFAPITHLGGLTGVVRNHWYNFAVNKVSGLGTPVYSPNELVTPVKPSDTAEDEWYLDTKLQILAWRKISQSLDLSSY